MKVIAFISLVMLTVQLQAQLTIKIVLKRNGDKPDTVITYQNGNGDFITNPGEIRQELDKGGKIYLQAEQGIKAMFSIDKRISEHSTSALKDAVELTSSLEPFKFNPNLDFYELGSPNESPSANIKNLIFVVKIDSIPKIEIDLYKQLEPFFGTAISDTDKDCYSCSVNYDTDKEMVIIYDFVCKCFYELNGKERKRVTISDLKIKRRKQVRLIIENVNRYFYDVSVKGETVKLDSQMPTLFRNFFFGDSTKLLGTLMGSLLNSDKTGESIKTAYDNLLTVTGSYLKKVNELKAKKVSSFVLCTKFDCCKSKDFASELEKMLNDLLDIRNKSYQLNKLLAAGESKVELEQNITDIKKQIVDCKSENRRLNQLIKNKEIELNVEKDPAKRKSINLEIAKAKESLCTSETEATLTNSLKELSEKLVMIKTIESLNLNLPDEEQVSELKAYVANMIQENGRAVQTPIYVDGSRLEFSIYIRPNDEPFIKQKNLTPLQTDSFSIILPVKGKAQFNFSSGSFMAVGKHLLTKTYDWQKVTNSGNLAIDSFRIVESGYTPLPLGFSAFLSMEWKLNRNVGFGPSVGVGITIEKVPRFGYMTGATLFLGELKQIGVTTGFLFMPINTIKNNFLDIYNKQVIYKVPPPIEYYKENRIGGFVSITYTPFNEIRTRQSRSGR